MKSALAVSLTSLKSYKCRLENCRMRVPGRAGALIGWLNFEIPSSFNAASLMK